MIVDQNQKIKIKGNDHSVSLDTLDGRHVSKFSHVLKHGNKVAHSLTRKIILSRTMSVWIEGILQNLFHVIQADLNGFPSY